MRLLILGCIWGIATAVALSIAWQTRVGPVLMAVSTRHGIHLGDVLAFLVAYVWAIVLSLALVPPPARHR